MITTDAIPALSSDGWAGFPSLKAALLEPLMIVAAALFWLATLPLAALALIALKLWQTSVALAAGEMVRPNPLILRRNSLMRFLLRRQSPRTAPV
jgi:hypothetical protein